MKAFSELFTRIDMTTSTNDKVAALVDYFTTVDEKDAIWCVALLTGKRPKRTVKTSELREWCAEVSGTPLWLLEESYHIVGDLAETIALLLATGKEVTEHSLNDVMHQLMLLADKSEEERKLYITKIWSELSDSELFVFNKLITGGFRIGVSSKIVIKALAKAFDMEPNVVALKLSGNWLPAKTSLNKLLKETGDEDASRPYPFFLAYALDTEPQELGDINEWYVERKLDGIRGQLIVRNNELFVWSRGEELLTDKFVEFHPLVDVLPNGTVLDGEIIPYKDDSYLPFHVMQTRIGRKNVTKKSLTEAPLIIVCYDLLEDNGEDIREWPLQERRTKLEQVLAEAQNQLPDAPLKLSPVLPLTSWEQAAEERLRSREYVSEGLMLKRKGSTYQTGRRRGNWWKWKVDPLSVDAVMIYAQRGHGRRADLYTDFTFAVWDGDTLVPFAKAYSGLTDKELLEIDRWVKRNTKEKFGPVRSVTPHHVFELGFEGIKPSTRHKSGVAVRFPRILRWRKDKAAKEANTKEDILALLKAYE